MTREELFNMQETELNFEEKLAEQNATIKAAECCHDSELHSVYSRLLLDLTEWYEFLERLKDRV